MNSGRVAFDVFHLMLEHFWPKPSRSRHYNRVGRYAIPNSEGDAKGVVTAASMVELNIVASEARGMPVVTGGARGPLSPRRL